MISWTAIRDLGVVVFCLGFSLLLGQMTIMGIRAILANPSEKLGFAAGVFVSLPIACAVLALPSWEIYKKWVRLRMSTHLPSLSNRAGPPPDWAVAYSPEGVDMIESDSFPDHAVPQEHRRSLVG